MADGEAENSSQLAGENVVHGSHPSNVTLHMNKHGD